MKWKILVALIALASPLRAQSTAAEDSLLRKQVRTYLDSIAKDRSAPGYSKRAQAKIDTLTMRHVKTTPPPVPAAPIATMTVTCDTTGSLLCQFDGTKSTGYKLAYAWDCGAIPNCTPGNVPAFTFTYPSGGLKTARVTVRDSLGRQSDSSKTFSVASAPIIVNNDTMPALPKSIPDYQPKPCARSVDVAQVMNLQTALNAAQPGDCLELAPGASWQGNFTLPNHTCAGPTDWVTIRTKGVTDIPGQRVTPAEAANWAKIINANSQFSFAMAAPAKCWQIMHLNIARNTDYTGIVYHLLVLGMSGSDGNTSPATQPTDIIVRRNWIHGTPAGELVRCVVVNGARLAVVDNWIDDCHTSGFDSQAVEGWNGTGPILIQNNFLAGAGENIMFGGAGPATAEMRPSDITIRKNHVYKDPAWKGVWSIKNIFELKNAQRLLIDANVFENSWAGSQIGFAIIFKSSTGGSADTIRQGSTDITFTNNSVLNANLGHNIQAKDCTAQACIVYPVSRVLIQNNRYLGIGTSNGIDGQGWLNPTYGGPSNVTVQNNTFVGNQPGKGKAIYFSGGTQAEWGFMAWRNNIFAPDADYAFAADCAQPTHMAAFDCIIGPGKWVFSGNVVSGIAQTYWSKNPPGNTYKATRAELGLQPNGSTSLFPGAGADITLLEQKIAGVVIPSGLSVRPRSIARRPKVKATAADTAWCATHACRPEK